MTYDSSVCLGSRLAEGFIGFDTPHSFSYSGLSILPQLFEKSQANIKSDIGNYFQRQIFPSLIINEETMTPLLLSKLIRSGTSQSEVLRAIHIVKVVTNENLCDALDREVPISIFQALIAKVECISESVLTCAIFQDRSQEMIEMLNSGKTTATPEFLLQKVKSRKVREALLIKYPDLNKN